MTAEITLAPCPTEQWKCGNELLPYHPSASHVDPAYRDGWNACYAALVQQMLQALETASEDSEEVLGNYKQLYSERYRPQRLASQQATVDANKAAISAAREWLGITGAPS